MSGNTREALDKLARADGRRRLIQSFLRFRCEGVQLRAYIAHTMNKGTHLGAFVHGMGDGIMGMSGGHSRPLPVIGTKPEDHSTDP